MGRRFDRLIGKLRGSFIGRLPKWIVYHCGIRLWANSTQGEFSNQDVTGISCADAIHRWEMGRGGDRAFAKQRGRARVLVLGAVVSAVAATTLGCAGVALTAEQRREFSELNAELAATSQSILQAQKEIEEIKPLYDEVRDEIAKAIKEKDLTVLPALYAKADELKGAYDTVSTRVQDLYAHATKIQKEQREVLDSGVPWYAVAGSWVLTAVSLASGAGLLTKLGTAGRIIGVLSRAGSAVADKSGNKKVYAEAIEADLDSGGTNTKGVTKALLRKHQLKAKGG